MRKFQNTAKSAALGTTALTVMLLASSGAWAQDCTSTPLRPGFLQLGGFAASTAGSVAGSIGNVNTAFLAQQGSAFVSAPGNPPPGSPGGGVWVRGVGGQVELKSSSTTTASQTPVLNAAIDSGTINCNNRERENFAGIQVGQDISRLNLDGLNIHLGTTAGYLESKAQDQNSPLKTNFEVPFVGLYGVVTKGGFFADAMVKQEFYNIELNNAAFNLHGQTFGARGLSASASAGYQVPLQNNWFIEPSAGIIWSRTKVDSFNAVGLPPPQLGSELSGTFSFDDIQSRIGRLTLRTGTSFTSGNLGLQPFASASVFREFADDVSTNYTTCVNCVFVGATPVRATFNTDTTRVGTWAQFSLGIAGQVLNTGWLGFVRGDYRVGENIEGWTGNAGVRYQFTPEPPPVVGKMVTKAPPLPVVVPVNWTGFYVGGFLGAAHGKTNFDFVGNVGTDPRIAGYLGGGQVGYNYQINQFVLGVEGDIGATNAHGSKTCGAGTGITLGDGVTRAFDPFFQTCSNDLDWIATLAGRVGVTWDRTLFYVKGGGAWTRENPSIECIIGPNNGNPLNARNCFNRANVLSNGSSATDTRAGWMLGWGTEFALTSNWSAKAEYNWIRFRDQAYTTTDGTALNIRDQINEVKIGVNYRFGPSGAIVAKY